MNAGTVLATRLTMNRSRPGRPERRRCPWNMSSIVQRQVRLEQQAWYHARVRPEERFLI